MYKSQPLLDFWVFNWIFLNTQALDVGSTKCPGNIIQFLLHAGSNFFVESQPQLLSVRLFTYLSRMIGRISDTQWQSPHCCKSKAITMSQQDLALGVPHHVWRDRGSRLDLRFFMKDKASKNDRIFHDLNKMVTTSISWRERVFHKGKTRHLFRRPTLKKLPVTEIPGTSKLPSSW